MQSEKKEIVNGFAHQVMGEVAKRLGDGYDLDVCELLKNNGIYRTAIRISKGAESISPIIYLDRLYDLYQSGNKDMDSIVDSVCETYNENSDNYAFDENILLDYDRVKDRLCFRLISAERNSILLKNTPHIVVCADLAVIFFVLVSDVGDEDMATVIVQNDLLDSWGITVAEAHEVAMKNTQQLLPGSIKGMSAVMQDYLMMDDDEIRECFELPGEEGAGDQYKDLLYVCTNSSSSRGAGVILYDGFLKDFADEIGSDLYILPSSVHEVLVVPMSELTDMEQLKNMVKEVNADHVPPIDILSDNVFIYHRETDQISVC